ncbi:thioredoxin domain-containing protein 12-like [Penaeus monodon]|uniref:thioredoxin domain-containing protein 12-like n=1 Tax=Penaeus monodon TaxID=6687 RepID=UPI0018A7D80A|nr:thioredoxin domain-containing protein 12-like [Penaeus monodon]
MAVLRDRPMNEFQNESRVSAISVPVLITDTFTPRLTRRMDCCALVSLIVLACFMGQAYGDDDRGRGLGEKFDWHTLEEGLKISETTGKPLMLIIHKSWCGACKKYPDGGYIPRILFLDSEGNVHPELYNVNGNSKYKYFYFDDKSVVASMKEAIKALSPASRGEEL